MAGVLAPCLLLFSCFTTVGKWTYPSGRYATTVSDQPATADVLIERFVDLRSETNRSWITWAYIPLSPGGWTHFDRPEATAPDDYTPNYKADPCEDLARSIADELRRGRLVQRVEYSADGPPGPGHTHVLRGKLRSFLVHESRWTYGLSIYAWAAWGLGLPMGTSANGFCVDLELVDLRGGQVAWQGSIFDSDSHIEGYYYGPEWYRFSWMWERRLREKLGEIAAALGGKPAPLPPNLSEELRLAPPPVMPGCLGVDSISPCSVR